MNPARRKAPAVLLAIILVGCGSSPPVSYYDLQALETSYVADGEKSIAVGVGPLRSPDYLSRSQIVTRRSDATIFVDDFNRWVEPVDDAIYRIVAENLDSLIDEAVVVSFPYTHISDLDYQVVGRISRFDADQAGTAILQIQWSVIGPGEDFVVQPRRARYEATAARPGDYPALALAMSEVLQQFSRDVAQALRAAMSAPGN